MSTSTKTDQPPLGASDAFEDWLGHKIGDTAKFIEAMVKESFQPVTPERQPYLLSLMPQFADGLEAAGFKLVDTPVFEIGSLKYCVKTRRLKMEIVATDKPEDLNTANPTLFLTLLESLKEWESTHVYSVTVARVTLFGYLAPTVMAMVRSAKVKAERVG